MNSAKNLIRKTLRNRWAQSALVTAVAAGIAYLMWGVMGLTALGGGTVGLGIPLLFGESQPGTDEDQAEHDRRWKWDGAPNDDGPAN